MLSIKGKGLGGTNTINFSYYNPVPFQQRKAKIKLVDFLGKPSDSDDLITISASVQTVSGSIRASYSLNKPFAQKITVGKIAGRLKEHAKKAARRLDLAANLPTIVYDEAETKKFSVKVPARTGISCNGGLLLALLGFDLSQLESNPWEEDTTELGLFNGGEEEEKVVEAEEYIEPNFEFRDLYDNLASTADVDYEIYEDWVSQNKLKYTHFFKPRENVINETLRVGRIESPADAVSGLSPHLQKLEEALNLSPGTFLLEERGIGLILSVVCVTNYDASIQLRFSHSAVRLLGGEAKYDFNLNESSADPQREGKRGRYTLGPIRKIGENYLESLWPLILKVDTIPSASFISGQGPTNILGFIDSSGEITSDGVPLTEYLNTLEIQLLRRDLTPLILACDFDFIATFRIMS